MTQVEARVQALEMVTTEPHSIAFGEFLSSPPEKLSPYVPFSQVTREAFAPFVIGMQKMSRGSFTGQLLYLDWIKVNAHFDYQTTFRNFLQAGWKRLSSTEKDAYNKAFRTITRHVKLLHVFPEPTVFSFSDEEIEDYTIGNLKKILLNPTEQDKFPPLLGKTKDEITAIIDGYVAEERFARL